MKLQLTHYARKGIYAYICPLTIQGSQFVMGDFINGNPVGRADSERFHKGQSVTVEIELSGLPDSIYQYKEAIGHKTRFGYIEVKSGEVTREWDSKEEMFSDLIPIPELPKLSGTNRQVSWAEEIRKTAIRDGIPPELAARKSNLAKDWIDHRENIVNWFQAELDSEGA